MIWPVCLSAGHTGVPAITAKPIVSRFRVWTRVGSRKHVLDGDADLSTGSCILRVHREAYIQFSELGKTWALKKRLNQSKYRWRHRDKWWCMTRGLRYSWGLRLNHLRVADTCSNLCYVTWLINCVINIKVLKFVIEPRNGYNSNPAIDKSKFLS